MSAADLEASARRLHQEGVQATNSGRPAVGAAKLRTGLRQLGWTEPGSPPEILPDLAGRLLLSLAWAESEQGRGRLAFTLLDQATELVDTDDRGVVLQQRGLMLFRSGNPDEALACLDAAIGLLDTERHPAVLARTLMNRGNFHLAAGRIRLGRADLAASASAARLAGLDLLSAKVLHNMGLADLHLGDIPNALRILADAEELYVLHGPDFLPVVQAARARALLSAGLADLAARTLDEAIEAFRRQRLTQDQGEAEAMRAQCALAAGNLAEAISWSDRAARTFRRRDNARWAAVAALVGLRARASGALRSGHVLRRARTLAAEMRELGLDSDAEVAELVAQRCALARSRARATATTKRSTRAELADSAVPIEPGGTAARVDGVRRWSFGWLETLVTRRLARAELALARRRPDEALAQARAGLAELHDRRSRLGSLDLRVGTAALGRELAELGLRTALATGRPGTVLTWSERSRAQAFRVLPVHAPEDPQTAEALAELRQLRYRLRSAELAGQWDPAAAARCAELERVLREREWQAAGTGAADPALHRLRPALGDRALVSYLSQDGELAAVVVVRGRARLVPLGRVEGLSEAVRRLLADVDVLAGRTLPERLAAVVHTSLGRQAQVLGERLISPLDALVGDRELVVVPTGDLAVVPWAMLPALRGRPVSVAPSATVWLAARSRMPTMDDQLPPGRDRRRGDRDRHGAVVLAAGPALEHVDREFDEIAALHPDCVDLRGGRADVAGTLAALAGARLAHLAGHGHHEPENVLFSRLDLADGPLMAYDIQRLATVPRVITLSACDIGRAELRTGDEQLGFTAALLYAGTCCVVSSVCRVSHETAANVMTGLHRALVQGTSPATALATAIEKEPLATFVAFGAG